MTEFQFEASNECARCSAEADEDRFEYILFDSTESTGSLASGNLCSVCFFDVMEFARGEAG